MSSHAEMEICRSATAAVGGERTLRGEVVDGTLWVVALHGHHREMQNETETTRNNTLQQVLR